MNFKFDSNATFNDTRNRVLIDTSHRDPDCEESSNNGHANHCPQQHPWKLERKWQFHEQVELGSDHTCKHEANDCAQQESTQHNSVLFIHKAAHALGFGEPHGSETAVLPNVLAYVACGADQQKEEGQDQCDCTNDKRENAEHTERGC